jgi:hypothetical protein
MTHSPALLAAIRAISWCHVGGKVCGFIWSVKLDSFKRRVALYSFYPDMAGFASLFGQYGQFAIAMADKSYRLADGQVRPDSQLLKVNIISCNRQIGLSAINISGG